MYSFRTVPHTADVKLIVTANNKEELFIGIMNGMFSIMHPLYDSKDTKNYTHTILVESSDQESLLVDFFSEILWLADAYNEAYQTIHFDKHTKHQIQATVTGKKIVRYQDIEIKAVTYHDLEISHTNTEWQATIVFDI